MINFIEGTITLDENDISVTSSYKSLNTLSDEGLVEKREDAGGIYYYVEDDIDGIRLGVFISLRAKKIEWLRLHWLDSPMKGWDDVSEKLMMDEYRLLSNLVKRQIGAPPNNRRTATCTWHLKWGKINVSYEPRSFQADIFMKPL